MNDLFHKTLQAGGITYVFRLPSSRDMFAVDNLAHKERGGNENLTDVGFYYSQAIALLNTLCEEPKDTDFGDLPAPMTDWAMGEVMDWIRSFRENLGTKAATGDTGSGA